MTKEEFCKLPPAVALRIVWDILSVCNSEELASVPAPRVAGAPKFDTRIARKGGMVQWASETDLEGLRFWKQRADQPASDPKYAEKNAKQAKALEYWIAYREVDPMTPWMGERDRAQVAAKPPSSKPTTYPRDAAPATAPRTPAPDFDAPEPGYTSHKFDGGEEYPF